MDAKKEKGFNLLPYIKSFRLRTLPLSASGVILGTFLAPEIHWGVFALTLTTTLLLQILSNIANELGDWQKGADTPERSGVIYSLQSGALNEKKLTRCLFFIAFLSLVSGTWLIDVAFGTLFSTDSLLFILLGALAITGALKYTLGKKPYGYKGMGDLSVFLFFGLLSVCGSYFLQAKLLQWNLLLPASAIGLMSVSVLNLNNIRDAAPDEKAKKKTMVLRMGLFNAKIYQIGLILVAMLLFCIFEHYEVLVFVPISIYHFVAIFRYNGERLDRQLPLLTVLTFLIVITILFSNVLKSRLL